MSITFKKITEKKNRRIGRGHGSGRVKTSGRGTKGQNARGKVHPGFEGGQLSLIKRMPFLRGKMRNKSMKTKAFAIGLDALNTLPPKTEVTVETLVKHKLVEKGTSSVKILSNGKLEKSLTVKVACSKGAASAIEKAGGTVVLE